MSLRDVQTIHVSNMLAWDLVLLLASTTKMVKTYCLVYNLTCTFLGENLKMLHIVKNCDVSTRAIQVLFRSAHLFWQTLLKGRFRTRLL